MTGAFLALDWGTTNVRAWVVDDAGGIVSHRDFALGVGSLAPGEAAQRFADVVRPAMGAEALPAILCGMIGSTLGWHVVPYLDCPADLPAVQAGLQRVDAPGAPVWIVPGLRADRPDGGPDVMRGEETQLFGWVAGDPARRRGEHLLCLPGTHAKWVRLVDGRIESFVTSMTGELFALLRTHSVLRAGGEQREDEAAFQLGLKAAGDGGALASRLFTARARVVGGDMAPASVESYLSGLLIGADVASVPALLGIRAGTTVWVVGDPALGARYGAALRARGHEANIIDGEDAALAGLTALIAGVQDAC